MTGRPPETGGPLRLGHVLDGFRIAAAARSMARRNHCFLAVCRVEVSEHANFCPGDDFGKPSPDPACLDPSHVPTRQRQWRSVTFKLNQLSLACPVKRAQPPWTVDDKALIP